MTWATTDAPLTIQPLFDGVRFVNRKVQIEVDTGRHTLRLVTRRGRVVEYAPSRAGLSVAIALIVRAFRLSNPEPVRAPRASPQGELFAASAPHALERSDVMDTSALQTTVRNLLLSALRRSAERRWCAMASVDEVIERVEAIHPTPLVFSAPFVSEKWIGVDVVKHRPAAIALALVESTAGTWARADWLWSLLAPVKEWPSFYAPHGRVTRALRKTLADFGDSAAPRDLWALRRLSLSRPVQSPVHLEILAELARVAKDGKPDPEVVRLVEHEHRERLDGLVDEIARALRRPEASRKDKVHMLCELLAQKREPVVAQRLSGVARALLPGTPRRTVLRDFAQLTALPPIPLPDAPEVTFLSTVRAVFLEGEKMDHCIGTRASRAVNGECMLFHVEYRGGSASAELDREGKIVEVAGPSNALESPACTFARQVLSRWGLPLQLVSLGALWQCAWDEPSPALDVGRPLRTLRDIVEVAQRLCARGDDDLEERVDWLVREARRALSGHAWLFERDEEVFSVRKDGDILCFRSED